MTAIADQSQDLSHSVETADISGKCCSRCGERKPLTRFKFDMSRQRFRTVCKDCANRQARQLYAADSCQREKINTRNAQYRKRRVSEVSLVQIDRERRRQYKRLGRICALPGYRPARHDAHVRCWRDWCKTKDAEHREAKRLLLERLHDAHVKAAGRRIVWLRRDAKPQTREQRIRRRAAAREQLSDSYIVRLLTNSRKSCSEGAGIPPALIDLKRVHLKLKRYLNQDEGEDE